jgi:hypothetical protein
MTLTFAAGPMSYAGSLFQHLAFFKEFIYVRR